MKREEKVKLLKDLGREIIHCQKCPLHKNRNNAVPGAGNTMSKLALVGEAPGKDEDEQGLPFVGRSGKLLEKVLDKYGLTRKDVFILNIIKCRPPENRNPEEGEIEKCIDYLKKQLDIIQPKVIVSLGRYSAQTLLNTETRIGILREEWHEYERIVLKPTYHPAYILRNRSQMPKFERDIREAIQRSKK